MWSLKVIGQKGLSVSCPQGKVRRTHALHSLTQPRTNGRITISPPTLLRGDYNWFTLWLKSEHDEVMGTSFSTPTPLVSGTVFEWPPFNDDCSVLVLLSAIVWLSDKVRVEMKFPLLSDIWVFVKFGEGFFFLSEKKDKLSHYMLYMLASHCRANGYELPPKRLWLVFVAERGISVKIEARFIRGDASR